MTVGTTGCVKSAVSIQARVELSRDEALEGQLDVSIQTSGGR